MKNYYISLKKTLKGCNMATRKGTKTPFKYERVRRGNKVWTRKKREVASDTDMRGKMKRKK